MTVYTYYFFRPSPPGTQLRTIHDCAVHCVASKRVTVALCVRIGWVCACVYVFLCLSDTTIVVYVSYDRDSPNCLGSRAA